MSEVYVSTDVESDGPIPGPNSMLSLGSAVFGEDKKLLDTFSVNLDLLPGAAGNPDTMAFWAKHPNQWAKTRENTVDPAVGMKKYHAWLTGLGQKVVFVGYPAGYDFLFTYWYLIRLDVQSREAERAVSGKTYAMAMLKKPFRESTKKAFPKHWFGSAPHTHVAVEDAVEQGMLFMNMLEENKKSGGDERWDSI